MKAYLIIHNEGKDTRFEIRSKMIRLGRMPDMDISLPYPEVSRHHCNIFLKNEKLYVEDQSSTYGTHLNEKQIEAKSSSILKNGDILKIGKSQVRLSVVIEQELESRSDDEITEVSPQSSNLLNAHNQVNLLDSESEVIGQSPKLEAETAAVGLVGKEVSPQGISRLGYVNPYDAELARLKNSISNINSNLDLELRIQKENMANNSQKIIEQMNEAKRDSIQQHFNEFEFLEKAKEEAQKWSKNAQQNAKQILTQAENEVQLILRMAHEKSEEILQEAEKLSADFIKKATEQANTLRMEATETSTQELNKSSLQAQQIISEAKKQAESILEKARKSHQQRIDEVNLQAEKILNDSRDLSAKMRKDFELEMKQMEDNERSNLQLKLKSEQEAIIEAEFKLRSLESKSAKIREDNEKQLANIQNKLQAQEQEFKVIESSKGEISQQLKNIEQKNAKIEDLKKQLEEQSLSLKLERDNLNNEIAKHQAQIKDQRESMERELKAHHIHLEEDFAKQKLAQQEKLESWLQEEMKVWQKNKEEQILSFNIKTQEFLAKFLNEKFQARLDTNTLASVEEQVSKIAVEVFLQTQSKIKNSKKSPAKVFIQYATLAVFVFILGLYLSPQVLQQNNSTYMADKINQAREKSNFVHLEQSSNYKSNYTDNVLYTSLFAELKLNKEVEQQWILKLNHFFLQELSLSDEAIVDYVRLESAMVTDLLEQKKMLFPKKMQEQIALMRQTEASYEEKLISLLGNEANLSKLKKFEADFLKSYLSIAHISNQNSRLPSSKK